MAETSTRAFGLYLRTLRERRGLSLLGVSQLSEAFAETVSKAYLSRCENGHQRLAFAKVVPLGRIYGISAAVLLERIGLDMELDRVGRPETDDVSYTDLLDAGKRSFREGFLWDAYGYLRDGMSRARIDPAQTRYRDQAEQIACSVMACATVAFRLGRRRYALHEYTHVQSVGDVGPRYLPLLLYRLATTVRALGDTDRARRFAEDAITAAREPEGRDYLGFAYATRGLLASYESDLEVAATYYLRSYRIFRDTGPQSECARSLNNLAQVYFDLGRNRAARRALIAAERVTTDGQLRSRALTRILLGEIEARESRPERAQQHWKEAVSIAKRLSDKVLRFKAEYHLLRHARESGNKPVARSIQRRLSRLSNYVPQSTPELSQYKALMENRPSAST